MGAIRYSSNDLKPHLKGSLRLSLSAIAGESTFSYMVATLDGRFKKIREWVFDAPSPHFADPLGYLAEVFESDSLLFSPFSSVHIAVEELPYQVLTEAGQDADLQQGLYDPDQAKVMLDTAPDAWNISYLLPKKILKEIPYYFSDFSVKHLHTCLLQNLVRLSASKNRKPLFCIVIRPGTCFVSVLDDRQILFANYFEQRVPEDVLYFAESVRQALEMEVHEPEYLLLGREAPDYLPVFDLHAAKSGMHFSLYARDTSGFAQFDLESVRRCG